MTGTISITEIGSQPFVYIQMNSNSHTSMFSKSLGDVAVVTHLHVSLEYY